jgi:hypothetical protein
MPDYGGPECPRVPVWGVGVARSRTFVSFLAPPVDDPSLPAPRHTRNGGYAARHGGWGLCKALCGCVVLFRPALRGWGGGVYLFVCWCVVLVSLKEMVISLFVCRFEATLGMWLAPPTLRLFWRAGGRSQVF